MMKLLAENLETPDTDVYKQVYIEPFIICRFNNMLPLHCLSMVPDGLSVKYIG